MAKKGKDELNEEFNFNSSEMTSEPVREEPSEMISELTEFSLVKKTESDEFLKLPEEFEPKIKKEENSQIEIEVEEVNLDDEVNFKSFV